jgi:lysophospholipase L1-like esterase
MKSLRERSGRPGRPGQVWLAAAVILAVVSVWAILVAVPRTHARELPRDPAPKAATATTTSTTPAPTTATSTNPAHRFATVVGIGDSVTSAAVCGCTGFVELVAAHLPAADGGPAHVMNLGAGGLTAAGLETSITTPGPTTSAVARGDILLITIGANDLTPLLSQWQTSGCPAVCYVPAVDAVGTHLAAILAAAKKLRGQLPTQVLVTDYWNVFADGDVAREKSGAAYLGWSDQLTRALNSRICTAARNAGATCVDLYAPLKGDGSLNPTAFLAGDGDHPNAAGHQLIASALLAATTPPRS